MSRKLVELWILIIAMCAFMSALLMSLAWEMYEIVRDVAVIGSFSEQLLATLLMFISLSLAAIALVCMKDWLMLGLKFSKKEKEKEERDKCRNLGN